ncbi:MAG TPA: hypothetical protein DE312_11160 [Gallionella sp.]|nr:MAG: hypothetical protein A2Z87_00775 [Gallionellales bacterium GWA2_54_124]OGT19415.1 MAG: hypothetical protein A2522_02765 [Gallionellales bacterium RIFOXYD12_FULL_53_10]HCI53852.1 hypothetical protein [Gallionella sp.]
MFFPLQILLHIFSACRGQPGSWLLYLASPRTSNQKEGDPGLPRLRRTLDIHKQAGLRNSHDPLRVQVLKQCSPKVTAYL